MEKIFYAILFVVFAINLSANEGLFIKSVDKESYPIISADIYNFKAGEILPTPDLQASDFELFENSSIVSINEVINPNRTFKNSIELVIYYDMAISDSNRKISKLILQKIINLIDYKTISCKLIGFDKINVMYNDFSNDIDILNKSSSYFDYSEYSNINTIFSFPKYKIEEAFSDDAENKSIILITDNNNAFDFLNLDYLITSSNIDFNTIFINKIKSESFEYLENNNTNYFQQNILVESETDSIIEAKIELNAEIILSNVLGYKPSTIIWNTLVDCTLEHSTTINYKYEDNNSSTFSYTIADTLKTYLEIKPDSLRFPNVLEGSITKDVFITARNGDIELNDIYLENNYDGIFNLAGELSSANELLREGDQYPLKLSFTPIDSSIVFTRLKINSSSCKMNEFEVIGGFPNVPPKNKTLELKYPNCDDILIIGEKTNVQWTGVMPNDVVQLEYSLNNGQTWDTLAKNRINLEYLWDTPNIESDSVLVRVIQLWPNNVGKTLNFPHTEALNQAVFSNDGSLIATGGIDSLVTIWNSNTGRKIREFSGHNGDILTIQFSNDDKYVLSSSNSSENTSAIMWDLSSESKENWIYKKFDAHSKFLFTAFFNDDNTKVISSSRDASYKIWDVNTETILLNSTISNRYFYANYSPKGTYYIVGRFDGFCDFYRTEDNTLFKSIDIRQERTSGVYPKYLQVSPDETEFLLIDNIHAAECTVWDIEADSLKFKLKHFDSNGDSSNVLHSSYFWKDNIRYILTSGSDNRIIQWDGFTGDSIVSFIDEHTNSITSAYYNFDGSRIVSASIDRTAKVWNLDERDLQMDSSDCVFKIVKVKAEARDVYLGEELIGQRKDTTIFNFLINKSTIPFLIKSIEIVGADRSDFKILNPSSFILDTNSDIDLRIAFTPKNIGVRSAKIKIVIPADTLFFDVSGLCLANELIVNNNLIDVGGIDNEDIIEYIEEKLISNLSSENINFDSVYITYPSISNFNIGNLKEIQTIQANGDLDLSIFFNPNEVDNYAAVLSFRHSLKNKIEKILLLGEGITPIVDTININLTDISANIGDVKKSILEYRKISSQPLSPLNKSFKLFLKYNNTILEPRFDFENVKFDNNFSELELIVNLDNDTIDSINLIELPFKVSLGNEESTKIEIIDIQPESKINIQFDGANVNILDHCYEGGIRLFESNGRFRLEQTAPNPAQNTTSLEYEVIEKGRTKLFILNKLGELVKTIFDHNAIPGIYQIKINLNDLPPGIYYYILEAPNLRSVKKLVVS